MGLITIPDLINHYANDLQPGEFAGLIQESLPPSNAETRVASSFNADDLLSELKEADLQWQPQEEILADGSIRYLYKRREGEPDLTAAELQRLLNSPPTFEQEQGDITHLLQALKRVGAKVLIQPTLKEGAAAEWDHKDSTLRIHPKIVQKGSVDFLRVLSHEAIHVAQSCNAGSLNSMPKLLGISVAKRNDVTAKLNDPIYADASQRERLLEKEAYAAQDFPSIARHHLDKECRSF